MRRAYRDEILTVIRDTGATYVPLYHAPRNFLALIKFKEYVSVHKGKETKMLVPLIAFETISSLYGEAFAKTWFQPVSVARK